MKSLEFIKQHVTEWPKGCNGTVRLYDGGKVRFTLFGFDNDTYSIDLSEHFAPDYHDGKEWTREEFEAFGGVEYRFNGSLPHPLLKRVDDEYYYFVAGDTWCKYEAMVQSQWSNAERIEQSKVDDIINGEIDSVMGIDATVEDRVVSSNKYEREISDRQGNSATVDVYDVLKAFDVVCPATQHALKKLLCTGIRGHKDTTTDLIEARESITRAIELRG